MVRRNLAPLKRSLLGLVVIASVALAVTSATSGHINEPSVVKPLLVSSNIPVPIRGILQRACQNCHSENTAWPWYSQIPLVSWQIHSDVTKGRSFMDLSRWNEYSESERRGYEIAMVAAVQGHLMPPPRYLWLHPEARLSNGELKLLEEWLPQSSAK